MYIYTYIYIYLYRYTCIHVICIYKYDYYIVLSLHMYIHMWFILVLVYTVDSKLFIHRKMICLRRVLDMILALCVPFGKVVFGCFWIIQV